MTQVLDAIAILIDGPRAWDLHVRLAFEIEDEGTTYLAELRNGAFNHKLVRRVPSDVVTFTLARSTLIGLVTGTVDLAAARADGTVTVAGDASALGDLISVLAQRNPAFAIVTP